MDRGANSYRRFLDGNDEGIVEIVGDYKDGLILFLNGYVNNINIAEELTEDTFFRLMVRKPRFSGKSSFKSWLYAIGRNVAVDYIRHNLKSADASMVAAEADLSDEAGLERAYIKEEQRLIIHKSMKKLPADYRQILWLVYFEGLKFEDVSCIMKKNSRQVRNLLYRAKQSLKLQLAKDGFIYEEY